MNLSTFFENPPEGQETAMLVGTHYGQYEQHSVWAINGVIEREQVVNELKRAAHELADVIDNLPEYVGLIGLRTSEEFKRYREWCALVKKYQTVKYEEVT